MSGPRLKPCPFCGEPGAYFLGGDPWDRERLVAAGCPGGHAVSPQMQNKDAAATWWNRRVKS